MPYQKISLQVKQSIIDAYRRDEDYLAAAALLNVERLITHRVSVAQQIVYCSKASHITRPLSHT